MAIERPLDRVPYYVGHFEHLDRVLNRPQLTGIGISGMVGVGAFVSSGTLIATSGSLGAPISLAVAGGISACVLYTLTEMVACRPLTGALIDLPHNFLDPACGFAVAVSYTLANIFSMATLTAYSAELTALLKPKPERHSTDVEVGINVALIALTTLTHCLGVKLYGKIERVIGMFKLSLFVLVCIMMIIINAGGGGLRQATSGERGTYRTNYTSHAFPPGFKPIGFNSTNETVLHGTNVPDTSFGIPGPGGRFFALLTTSTIAMFTCMGGEMVATAAGEAKHPFKDIPVVMSFVYLVPLSLYPFILLSGAANVNYADAELPKQWARGTGAMSESPFVIALQSSSLRGVSKVLNGFFVVSSYTAANTAMYVSSRAVFILSQQYLPRKMADTFGRTNNGHTPLASILLCSVFGFISLAGLSKSAYSQPRQTLSEFFVGSLACVYICECITFLKFKAGLERLEKRGILSRNDPLYISRLFKSRWQPLPAYIGIVGCSFVTIWSGVPSLYILGSKSGLTSSDNLKSTAALACDVLGAYTGPLFFAIFYLTYKYITPRSFSVDLCDLTSSHYILGDLSKMEAENPITITGVIPPLSPVSPVRPDIVELEAEVEPRDDVKMGEVELSSDMQEEREGQVAREEESQRIEEVLRSRSKRLERRLLRELWSCVVADPEEKEAVSEA